MPLFGKPTTLVMDVPGPHCENRLWEWGAGITMIGIGVLLDAWPDALASSKFRFMLDVLQPYTFTLFYLVSGCVRVSALWLNGRGAPYTAYIRACTAVCGGFAWLHMAWSLFVVQNNQAGPPSPSLVLLIVLTGLELITVYRALGDAKYRYRQG